MLVPQWPNIGEDDDNNDNNPSSMMNGHDRNQAGGWAANTKEEDSSDDDDDVLLRRLGALHGSHLGPLVLDNRQFVPDSTLSANSLTQITDGLSDASVRLPSTLHAWVARRVRGVDQRGGYESCVEVERSLDEFARVAPSLPGAVLARHLAHVSNSNSRRE